MENQYLLTPFFLDERDPHLDHPAWRQVTAEMPEDSRQARMGALYRALADEVAGAVAAGRRPVNVAGDCCAAIGFLAGLQRAGLRTALIWFDAHGDFNTWDTTPSGFLGGMPLAMLVGRGEQTLLTESGATPLPESQVILTDARDLDPGERESLAASSIRRLADVEALLAPGAIPDGPLWVHFDVDVIRTEEMPAVNYPAAGGPTAETVRRVLRALAETGRVAAVSVSAWEPEKDPDGRAEALTMELVETLTAT